MLVLLLSFLLALALGAKDYAPALLWQALSGSGDPGTQDMLILREMRLPRALAGVLVGAALAVSGFVMQAITRNPLADPGLTGVNAGAALAVVIGLWLLGPLGRLPLALLALGGAGAAGILVRLLAGPGDTLLRLPLAGAAMASFCMAVVSLLVLLTPETRNIYRFWMVGSLAQADLAALARLAPVALAGILCAVLIARQVEALMLGQEMGRALGVASGRVLLLALLAVSLTAGACVALAGPVGFIGLIAPHLARRLAPRAALSWQMLIACPLGGSLALMADTAGRRIARPEEWPLGILLAVIGAPVFMALVRQMLRRT